MALLRLSLAVLMVPAMEIIFQQGLREEPLAARPSGRDAELPSSPCEASVQPKPAHLFCDYGEAY
jgi:hypothetical protein